MPELEREGGDLAPTGVSEPQKPRTKAGRELLDTYDPVITNPGMPDEAMLRAILSIEAEASALDIERLARALMVAANNGDRETTQTAYATAIRIIEALDASAYPAPDSLDVERLRKALQLNAYRGGWPNGRATMVEIAWDHDDVVDRIAADYARLSDESAR